MEKERPDPKKFAHDFDAAVEERINATETSPTASEPAVVNLEIKADPAEVSSPSPKEKQSYVYRPGDEFAATSKDWKEKGDIEKISDKEKWSRISEAELDLNAELAEMKKEMDEFGKRYSKISGEASAKQSVIKKLNPLRSSEDYDEVKQSLSEWGQKRDEFARAFYQDLAIKLSRGDISEKVSDQQSYNLDALMAKEILEVHGQKFDFKKDFSEGKGWISPKIANGYNNLIGKFRKMHPALRIGMGAGIFVVGNVPASIAWRALGGLAAGKGTQEGLQAAAEIWRQRKERKDLQRFEKDMSRRNLSAQERINLRIGHLERQNQHMGERMAKYARGDYYRKFAGVVMAVTVGSGTLARLIQGTGMGSAIKEKIFGLGSAKPNISDQMALSRGTMAGAAGGGQGLSPEDIDQIQKALEGTGPGGNAEHLASQIKENMHYTHDTQGHITGLTPEGNEHFKAMNIDPFDSASHPNGPPNLSWEEYNKINTYGANSSAAHEVGIHDMRAPDAPPQVVELSNRELGFDKVQTGGGIERSAQHIIRANPKAFGLNPDDPRLTGKIGMKAHELAEGMRLKFGLSHEKFNDIASHHIQEGDEIRIFKDSATGKFNMTYNGAAFDHALSPDNVHGVGMPAHDVSHGGAAQAHEIASNKPQMIHEPVKQHGLSAAEHQNRAGGMRGKIQGMEEIEARQRAAQVKYANADRDFHQWHDVDRPKAAAENVHDLAKTNTRLFMANRGLLNRVFEGAGISKHAHIFEQPMSEWDKLVGTGHDVAQDVQFSDAVNIRNFNFDKLNNLREILQKYNRSGYDSIGECLRRALADPNPNLGIDKGSVGAKVQQLINGLVLNK